MSSEKASEKRPESSIQFKPLSQGLGFHPFSDGLPYAPQSPTQTKTPTTGSGAVAAGPPAFVNPARTRPLIPPSAAATSAPKTAAAVAAQVAKDLSARPSASAPRPAPVAAKPAVATLGMGYVAQRVAALIFDITLQTALGGALFWAAARKGDLTLEMIRHPSVAFVLVLFGILLNWMVLTFQEVSFKTSLGKKLLGLGLEGSRGAIFVRAFFFIPSFFFGGLGVLWTLIDRRKRGWHDWIADCQPQPLKQTAGRRR